MRKLIQITGTETALKVSTEMDGRPISPWYAEHVGDVFEVHRTFQKTYFVLGGKGPVYSGDAEIF
jgi:hypothetical protein